MYTKEYRDAYYVYVKGIGKKNARQYGKWYSSLEEAKKIAEEVKGAEEITIRQSYKTKNGTGLEIIEIL